MRGIGVQIAQTGLQKIIRHTVEVNSTDLLLENWIMNVERKKETIIAPQNIAANN